MYHIHKLENNLYLNEITNDQAKQALEFGTAYVKIDGSNWCIEKSDNQVKLYKRYDQKNGKVLNKDVTYLSLMDGNISEYGSNEQKHNYHYELVEPKINGKKNKYDKMIDKLYQIVEQHQDQLPEGRTTIETVGKNFNNTPGIEDIAIAPHHLQLADQMLASIEMPVPRTYEELDQLFQQVAIEGLVYEYHGIYWKTRSNCFNKESPFELLKKGKLPDGCINLLPIVWN